MYQCNICHVRFQDHSTQLCLRQRSPENTWNFGVNQKNKHMGQNMTKTLNMHISETSSLLCVLGPCTSITGVALKETNQTTQHAHPLYGHAHPPAQRAKTTRYHPYPPSPPPAHPPSCSALPSSPGRPSPPEGRPRPGPQAQLAGRLVSRWSKSEEPVVLKPGGKVLKPCVEGKTFGVRDHVDSG